MASPALLCSVPKDMLPLPTPTRCAVCCQVNLLVLHEAFSPSTPRLLREAAALLSPQSVAMPVTQAEHVTPITAGSGSDQSAKAVFASILHLANTGRHAHSCALCSGNQFCPHNCWLMSALVIDACIFITGAATTGLRERLHTHMAVPVSSNIS